MHEAGALPREGCRQRCAEAIGRVPRGQPACGGDGEAQYFEAAPYLVCA